MLLRYQGKWEGTEDHWILNLASIELEKMICVDFRTLTKWEEENLNEKRRIGSGQVSKGKDVVRVLGAGD